MAYSCNILLGRIIKVSGSDGTVSIKLEKSFIGKIPQMESVFLEIEGRPVPFFIHESDYSANDILKVRFMDYDSADKVSEFKGSTVFLTTPENEAAEQVIFRDLARYEVLSEDNTHIGYINEVIQNPGQWLLNITSPHRKQILIPFHEDLVILIDHKKKVIILKIPEGLTEIN